MNKPDWMSDPAITHIPQEKLNFLSEMFEKIKEKNQKELMPFLMAMTAKNKQSIHFTTEEIQSIIAAIKRASSEKEQQQIDHVLHMAQEKAKQTPPKEF